MILRVHFVLREGNTEMSDLVEHELVEWSDTSEARLAQKEASNGRTPEWKTWPPPLP